MDADHGGESGPHVVPHSHLHPHLHGLWHPHQRRRHRLPLQEELQHDVPQAFEDLGHLGLDCGYHLWNTLGNPNRI